MSEWTIDTCVLIVSDDTSNELFNAANLFLLDISKNHRIAISEEVLREYENRALLNKKSNAAIWYSTMAKKGKIEYYFDPENDNTQRLRLTLLNQPLPNGIGRFDDDDISFVVLAYRTPDKKLTSIDINDGDFSSQFTNWIFKVFLIDFYDIIITYPYFLKRH